MPIWKIADRSLSADRTLVMAILNVTPDSFSDGGCYVDPEKAVKRALELQAAGADVIDIGAQSTRPGYTAVSSEEEWARLEPVLTALAGRLSVPISVDTYLPEVAVRALDAGAQILNDVSGSLENGFLSIAAKSGAGLVITAPTADVAAYFDKALAAADAARLDRRQICLDIGIGFGKNREEDMAALRALPTLSEAFSEQLLMVGASRKRVTTHFAGDLSVDRRLGGTVAFHTLAQAAGARMIRVHDVEEAVQAARLTDVYVKGE